MAGGEQTLCGPLWDPPVALQDMALGCSRIGVEGGHCSVLAMSSGMSLSVFRKSPPPLFSDVSLLLPSSLGKVIGPPIPQNERKMERDREVDTHAQTDRQSDRQRQWRG